MAIPKRSGTVEVAQLAGACTHLLSPAESTTLFCRLLIQAYGFQTTFLITAVIKLASWIPLIVLMCLVEDGVCTQAAKQRSHPAQIEHIASGNDRTLRAPLLAAGDQEGQCNSLDHVHQRTDHERTGYPTRVDCHAANAAGANHAQESS